MAYYQTAPRLARQRAGLPIALVAVRPPDLSTSNNDCQQKVMVGAGWVSAVLLQMVTPPGL